MANKIDPITGLQSIEDPKKPTLKTDPITGESYIPSFSGSPLARPQPITTQYSDNISKYQKYNVPLRQEFDWNEQRAQRQSTTEKWGHGLLKAGVTTVGAIADNTLGVLEGIGGAIVAWDADKLYDTNIGGLIDKTNNWMQENVPNYYTEAERNSTALESLGYANFWADKVANGVGYAVGSIGTVYLTGGMGLASRGISAASKGLKTYRAAKAISGGVKTEEAIRRGAAFGKFQNAIQVGEIGAMMSYGESSVEAREVLHRTTEKLTNQRAKELGIHPSELSAADIKEIKDTAAHAGNVAFGLNMAVLATTNFVTFGKMLLPKYTNMRPAVKAISKNSKTGKFTDTWAESPLWKTTAERYLKVPAVSSVSETFQEGTQFAIQEAADKISNSGKGSIEDWTEAMIEGYGETFGTKEGQESMMLGFIIGGLMGGGGSFRQRLNKAEEDKGRKQIVDALNSDSFVNTIDSAQTLLKASEASQRMQVALEEGDHKAYRDAQFDLIAQQIKFHEDRGSMDLFTEKIDDAAKLPDSEFAAAFGIPEGVKFDKAEIIAGVKSKIKDYQTLKDQIDAQFPSRPKQGIERTFMSKEQKEQEENELQDEKFYKSLLLEYGLNLNDSNKRISSLIEEINQLRGEAGPVAEGEKITEEDLNLITTFAQRKEGEKNEQQEAINAKLKDIQDKVSSTNPLFTEVIESKIKDLVDLSNGRDIARSALKELYADPKTRKTALDRAKRAEKKKENDKRDSLVREKINESANSDHIAELLKSEDISEELKQELNGEYNQRVAKERELDNELYYKTLEEVEEMLKEGISNNADPFKLWVMKRHVSSRRKSGEVNAREKKESTKTEDRKAAREERKAKREEEKKALREEQEKDAEEAPSSSADTITSSEENAPTGETVTTTAGEFNTDASYNLIVDSDGKVTVGRDSNQPSSIDRSISQREGLEGTEVELKLLDPVQTEGGEVQAVGVFIEGNLAGVLGESSAVKVRPRLEAGETVNGEVSERYFNNVNNLRTETGEKVFLPANEALQGLTGFVGYAIYAGSIEGETSPRYDFGDQKGVTEASNALNKGSRANDAGFTPGQVVLVVKTPRGEFKPIAVSTNELGRESVGAVLDSLSEGTLQGIIDARELAGITKKEDSPSAFTISQSGVISMPFKGEIIEITPEELAAIRAEIYNPERAELTPEVLEALKTTIAELKTQVALENLGIDSTYLSPITNKSYNSYREYIEAEVLRTDFKVINGSIFNNVGLVISLAAPANKNQIIESFSFDEEASTAERDITTESESAGKEASGKFGDGLLRLSGEALNTIDTKKAKAWLQKRFGKKVGIIIFDNLQKIGDDVIHGYMENAAIHLYRNAEVGTEYHEGFHLFFRGLLTDEQRQSLYDDAVAEFGEPTADDIKNARRGKPDLSNKEARLLALEERMAEEFRDYSLTEEAPKTLGQKIVKFFKDLLAYIKALATDRVSVRQAFRLLEANKIPKAFTRNASTFSPGKSYMLKEYTQTPRLHKEKIDLILYNTLNLLDSGNFTIEELIGNTEDKDSMLRNWFLRHALSKEGEPLSSEDFETFKETYDSAENVEDVKKVMSDLGIKVSPPMTDFSGNPLPGKTAGSRRNGLRFIAIYDNWFDTESELGGIPIKGFRSEVADRLKTDFGYKVLDTTEVDTESEFERLFSLSRLEEEPAKKLSQKAKRVLSRIPVQDLSDSFFGFQTYMPIIDVFNELSGAVADSSNLEDMLENLKQQKNSVNSLNAVYDFIIGLGAQEQALLFSTLSLGMNAHRTLLISQTDNGAQTIIFSPVKATIKKYYTNKWRNSAVGGTGVYSTVVNDKGDFVGYTVDPATISEIQKNAKVLFEGLENPGAKEIEAFSNALWAMGMPLASSKAASRKRALEVFSIDGRYKENLEVFIKSTQLESILTQKFAPGKNSYTNIFETESTTVGKIADMIMSKFESPKAASFLGGTGNMIYALNLKSDLTITKEMIRTGEYGEMFVNAIGHQTERASSLGTTLLNNLNYQELFEPIDLDASKFISEEGEDTKEYSNMTFEDALAISLNMAFPSSGNVRYIAIDTQGDRDRLTFVPIPKWEQRKVKGLFDLNQTIKQGTFRESTRSIIENYVLLDLHRISKELSMENRDELMTYHTENRFRSFQVGGELDASQDSIAHDAASYMDNSNTEMPEELMKFLDSKVEEVLSNFEEYYNEIVKKVGGEYNLKQLVINKVDNRSYIKGKETDLVKSFIVHDMIGRLVSREIFRTGINHVKNGADYNKRSALTTTPGTILMIAGSSSKDLEYGMSPTFNEITVKDIYTSLPKKQLKNLKKALTKQVGKDEANKIIKAYSRSNSTDAQAFISPSMYRNIRMGMGLWSKEDQEVYENYVNTGEWTGSIMPLKPSYEFRVKHQGRIIPISHKNSYIVLTRELAKGNTTLSTLLDRMEAVNKFEGLSPVDVVNVESAKKTGSFAPIDAEDANALASSPVMVLDSRGLKFPQILPEKNSYQITFGRQPRKNMIANIGRENNYFIEGVKVSGEELFNIYQEAITAKLQKNTDKVLKRLGYDKVLNAKNADERLKALNDLLPKLQEVMTELGVEKDYPQNILDALEIVKDENGNLSTAIPLAFPQVQSKLQQLLFGMFRKEIYQQKMLGMEMVQFSEFAGKSEVDNSLKFYDVKGGKVTAVEVDIRYDVLERLGIDPSLPREQISEKLMTLIGYRIPQQGKSSTLIMKVRNILPASHKASIRVPGAVTTMMGSDFDIDKMFILFPEAVVKEDGSIDKVSINYSRLKKSKDFSRLSLKQLNNIIFDSIVAVGTSINHLSETVAPLDIVDIEEAREAIGKSKENIDINNPGTRLQTGVDNMLSGILRGIYANGVAGRNVAEASNIVFEGLPIVVDGKSLSSIVTKSPFTGKYTDYYLSQYLSAAVDSVKDPIQAAINDNALTAPLTIYMLSIGMTPKQIVAFLNVPVVKAQIDEAIKTQKSIKQLLSDFEQNERMSLNTETMLKIASGEITKYDRTEYLRNLKTIALQAESLDRLYRTISPDSIDKAGTIPQHLAKLDVKSSAEASSPVFGGSEALASLTEGDSYKIVRGYYEAISKSLDVAADLGFISNQKAVQNFKKSLKIISGRQTLTPEMHRDINRALLHHLVTKPGSPIFESDLLLETKVLYNHMEGGLESLLSDMKEITEGTSNAVVESLIIETTETQKGEFSKYSLDVDKVNTTLQKNYFTATLKGMMDNPSLYGEENKETVEKFVEAFVSNSIVTSGFAPSPTATFSLVPVEYFKRLKVGEHIRNEIKNLESDTAFPMSVEEFIINYGYQKFGGKYIFRTPYKGNLDNTISLPDRRDVYVIANKKNKETKVITTAVYVQVTEGVYERIQTKGQQKLLYEANLKSSDGRPVRMDRSIINPIITSEITPSTGRTIPRGTPVQPIQQTSKVEKFLVDKSTLKDGDVVYDKVGTKFIYRGVRQEGKLGAGSPRLERTDGSGEIAIPGINIKLYTQPSEVETAEDLESLVNEREAAVKNIRSIGFTDRSGESGVVYQHPPLIRGVWINDSDNKQVIINQIDAIFDPLIEKALKSTQQSSEVEAENISSKGSEFAKKLTNPGNNLKVTYKGREFRNAEHAYQTYKSGEFDQKAYDSNAFKPVGSKPANRKTNYQTMVDILKAKLEQHSELIEGINQRGGLAYIEQSTHNVTGDKFWESKGQNKFIEALADAYKSIQPAQQTSEVKPLTASESNTIEKDIENTVTESLREKIFRIGKVPFEKTEFENINVLVKKINDNEFSIAVDNKGKNIFGLVSAVLDFQRRDLDNNSIYAPNPKGFILWETFLNSEVGSSSKAKTIIDNRFSITLGTLKALKNNGIEFINFPERFAEDFKNEYSQFLEQDLSSVGFTDVTDKRIKTIRISIDNLIRAISLKNNNQQAAAQQPNKSKISLLEKETPHGSAQKITRLRENFAAAGIDVTVVEAELPPGEKGQVVGDLIVIDPNQIEADTVYHEFGHILVDMLPEDEVDAYIEQVKKANPELVDIVTAKYPELSGRDLGKEILVTAIGLEGARIERKSPSKLQRIVNKILRALGKLFGVKPNAASILAERMFAGEIRAEMLTGSFNPKVQKSKKLQDDITKTFEEVTITLKRQLIRIENLPETEKTKSRIREIKTLQKNLSNIEENMSDMSQFLNFQQYVVARVDTLEVLMDKIYDLKDQKLSSKEALQVLRNIGEIKETIDSLYNTEKDKSTIHKMKKLMRNIPFGDRTSLEVAEVRMDLEDAIDRLEDLEQDYQDIILPLVADTLLTFGDTSINDSLDKEIERVRRTKDISSFRRFSYLNKNPEYLALKKKRKDMTREEYRDAMVEVKINDLKSKRLGRDQIIAELRDAHASKGRFSYYLDPMVYSNEANMQLFALSIKDAINNANEKSRGFLYLLEKQYSKFKDWKGKDFNEQEFNDDLLTTTTITRADGSTIKLLSLVQEYDVEDFYSKRNETIERLNKTYKKPTEVSELSKWRKSNNGKLHREELSKWYKENTTKIKGAEKILSDMRLRTSQITKEINDLPEDNLDAKNILKNELSELINKIKNSYRGGVFMGDLAAPSEKYKSDKYKKIMATPELKEYYDFVVQSYHASQKKIGRSELFINSWDKYSYVMPSVRKDLLAALQQEGWIDLANESIKDFRRLETDTQFGVMTNADGGKVKSIPRFYTNQVSHEQVSRDIASSLAQFTHMANTFEEKSNVVGLVETMLTLHENRKTLSIDAVTGLPIIDNIASRVKKEGNSYVLKPGVENNAYKHLQEFVDSVFYGQFDIDEGSLFGANISKLAGKAAALTATANLAFNSLQIGNQFILDNLMSAEEAVAGQFYSKSDYAWAVKTYAQMKGALGDLGKFVPKSKLGQAMQMFDALNEVSDTIGKNLTGNKLKKAMQSDPLFAMQHAVEHQSTGTRLLALLHSTKVTDENNKAILNEDGSEANLWDMLIKDKNGKLIIDPRVKNIDKNRIISKLHGINKRTNQVKGSFDRSMGSRRALGKMLLLFRNYFIPGLRKRFGHGEAYHVDHELGDITRGMYLSVISYIGSIAEGGGVASSYQMMSETDKQNLKRSLYEASAAMTTAIVFGMLNSMIDMDDDDEDSYALVYSAYQARRLQTELLQFINPGEFMHIIESPMATVNWASKYYDIITQVTLKEPGYFLGLVDEDKIFYQRRTGTAEKGDRKVFNKIKKVVPVLNGWQTSFLTDSGSDAVKEKIRWFEQ